MHLLVGVQERAWKEKCVSGLRRLGKTLNFLRCLQVIELVLKCGSDIIERNRLEIFFHFIILIGIVASVFRMSFLQQCFRFQFEIFSYCTLKVTFAIGFQKWIDLEWSDFGCFFVAEWLFCLTWYQYRVKFAGIAHFSPFLSSSDFFDV